jgi:hypothetical protein
VVPVLLSHSSQTAYYLVWGGLISFVALTLLFWVLVFFKQGLGMVLGLIGLHLAASGVGAIFSESPWVIFLLQIGLLIAYFQMVERGARIAMIGSFVCLAVAIWGILGFDPGPGHKKMSWQKKGDLILKGFDFEPERELTPLQLQEKAYLEAVRNGLPPPTVSTNLAPTMPGVAAPVAAPSPPVTAGEWALKETGLPPETKARQARLLKEKAALEEMDAAVKKNVMTMETYLRQKDVFSKQLDVFIYEVAVLKGRSTAGLKQPSQLENGLMIQVVPPKMKARQRQLLESYQQMEAKRKAMERLEYPHEKYGKEWEAFLAEFEKFSREASPAPVVNPARAEAAR